MIHYHPVLIYFNYFLLRSTCILLDFHFIFFFFLFFMWFSLQLIQMHLHPHHHNFTMHNSKISHYIQQIRQIRCKQMISITLILIILIISINRTINFKCNNLINNQHLNSINKHRNNLQLVDTCSSSLSDNLQLESTMDHLQIINTA